MAMIFGVFIDPDLFGSFILVSFFATASWTIIDPGLKQRALQMPFKVDLTSQKSLHFILGVIVSLILYSLSFYESFLNQNQARWLLEFALITPLVATGTTSYVWLYWNKSISFLAFADAATHLLLQPLALLLLWIGELHWALTVSFILPHVIHTLIVLYKAPIEFHWDNMFLINHLKPSLLLGLNDLLTQFRTKGDTLLLGWLSNPYIIGLYNRGYAFPHHASNFIQSIIQPLLIPQLANKSFKIEKKQFLLTIFSAASFLVAMFWVFNFILSKYWLETWTDLIFLLPVFILWAWGSLLSGWHETLLKSSHKNTYVLLRQSALTIVTLLLIIILYKDFRILVVSISLVQMVLILIEGVYIYEKRTIFVLGELTASLIVGSGLLLYL
jgi:O-antigen/teichoic acid export membrane protein